MSGLSEFLLHQTWMFLLVCWSWLISWACHTRFAFWRRMESWLPLVEKENVTLYEDIVLEILSWLPKKYFYRFKCVSRRWNAMISSLPRFPQKSYDYRFILQTNLLPTRIQATFFRVDGEDGDATPERSLTFVLDGNSLLIHSSMAGEHPTTHHPPGDFSIAGSCKGFLLLQSKAFFHVYDPSSNLWESLPPPPTIPKTDKVGFAVHGSHYKVMYLSERPQQHPRGGIFFILVFQVFSSETRKWKERKVQSVSSELPEPQTVFVGRHLYWLVAEHLIVFRFNDESHHFVELPDHEKRFTIPRNGCIWEAEGYLQYCDTVFDRIRIWALRSDVRHGSRPRFWWQKKHDVVPRFADSPGTYIPDFRRNFFPCGFDDDFGIVYLWFRTKEQCDLLSCSAATGVLKQHSSGCWRSTPNGFIPFSSGEANSLSLQKK